MNRDRSDISVLVASGDSLIGRSLCLLLEDGRTTVSVCLSRSECESDIGKTNPDVLVIDATFESSIAESLAFASRIHKERPSISILMLSTSEIARPTLTRIMPSETVWFRRKDHMKGQDLPTVVRHLANLSRD